MNKTTNVTKLLNRLVETKAETCKLGIDQHARNLVVCVQLDGALPLRPQKLAAVEVLQLVRKLVAAGVKVYSCYESGPCGYWLDRALREAGATNYVVVPQLLGDGRQQKTDQLDAVALTDALDRYVRGNQQAFSVVTVPTPEQEDVREEGRLREQCKATRHEWEARGRSLLLFKGQHVTGPWWQPKRWAELQPLLPVAVATSLETMRQIILTADAQEKALRQKLEAAAPQALPKSFGALTWVLLMREMYWRQFKNRRQVASYTGLCPGVYQTGGTRRDGAINRFGSPRVRHLLIELVWRLARYQPDYPPVRALVAGVVRGAARRKCAVAAARRLAIDLWRLATGQTTPQNLKLIVPTEVLA
jgi:transposase